MSIILSRTGKYGTSNNTGQQAYSSLAHLYDFVRTHCDHVTSGRRFEYSISFANITFNLHINNTQLHTSLALRVPLPYSFLACEGGSIRYGGAWFAYHCLRMRGLDRAEDPCHALSFPYFFPLRARSVRMGTRDAYAYACSVPLTSLQTPPCPPGARRRSRR